MLCLITGEEQAQVTEERFLQVRKLTRFPEKLTPEALLSRSAGSPAERMQVRGSPAGPGPVHPSTCPPVHLSTRPPVRLSTHPLLSVLCGRPLPGDTGVLFCSLSGARPRETLGGGPGHQITENPSQDKGGPPLVGVGGWGESQRESGDGCLTL